MPTLSDNMAKAIEGLRVSGADLWKMTPMFVGSDLSVLAKHLYWMGQFQQSLLDEGWAPKNAGMPADDSKETKPARPKHSPYYTRIIKPASHREAALTCQTIAELAIQANGSSVIQLNEFNRLMTGRRRADKSSRAFGGNLIYVPLAGARPRVAIPIPTAIKYMVARSYKYRGVLTFEEAMNIVNTELKKLNKEAA